VSAVLVGYHPHGIIGVGAFVTFITNATGFEQAFPGRGLHSFTFSST
jgi:2-acylglycerol O-acyltransferase 2